MDQLVLLIIIGLISLVNWVIQKASEKRERARLEREAGGESGRSIHTQQPQRNEPPRRAKPTARDTLKELMDALGLPPDAAGSPTAAPRTAPGFEEEFASLEETLPPPPQHRPKQAAASRWQPPRVVRPDAKMAQLASSFAQKERISAAEKPRPSSVRAMLADRASKRHAIVLAEILGAPRAFQPGGAWGAAR